MKEYGAEQPCQTADLKRFIKTTIIRFVRIELTLYATSSGNFVFYNGELFNLSFLRRGKRQNVINIKKSLSSDSSHPILIHRHLTQC